MPEIDVPLTCPSASYRGFKGRDIPVPTYQLLSFSRTMGGPLPADLVLVLELTPEVGKRPEEA